MALSDGVGQQAERRAYVLPGGAWSIEDVVSVAILDSAPMGERQAQWDAMLLECYAMIDRGERLIAHVRTVAAGNGTATGATESTDAA